jgi:hypothetical protein
MFFSSASAPLSIQQKTLIVYIIKDNTGRQRPYMSAVGFAIDNICSRHCIMIKQIQKLSQIGMISFLAKFDYTNG